MRKADPRYQIGKGKTEDIAQLVKKHDVERVIFNNRLKSVQAYNLAKIFGVEVIDRFQLILEIFTRRASTAEAKLQIQLAKLRYELAHARERVRLAKMEEQPGFMGLGAYEVDVYHQAIQKQVNAIQQKLSRIKKTRSLHRKRRQKLGFYSISLAGYTYAGKSTLFNALVEEVVPTGKGLFTTLSTTTRIVQLFGRRVLLTDTVGFIDQLPITLIDAFRSTLEETIFSDLILLVIDASESPKVMKRKITICLDTIRKIGADGIPIVAALNKADLLTKQKTTELIKESREMLSGIVPISALHNTNIDLLRRQLARYLPKHVQAAFSIPLSKQNLSFLSWLFNHTHVKSVRYQNNSAYVTFESVSDFAAKALKHVKDNGGSLRDLDEVEA